MNTPNHLSVFFQIPCTINPQIKIANKNNDGKVKHTIGLRWVSTLNEGIANRYGKRSP